MPKKLKILLIIVSDIIMMILIVALFAYFNPEDFNDVVGVYKELFTQLFS